MRVAVDGVGPAVEEEHGGAGGRAAFVVGYAEAGGVEVFEGGEGGGEGGVGGGVGGGDGGG